MFLRIIAVYTVELVVWLSSAEAQVIAPVTVDVANPIRYAQNAVISTMPATGLGLGSSVYAGNWANPATAGFIHGSGTQMIRYPGGSYSDIYNWSLGTANNGGYVAPNSSMGTYFKVLDQSGAQGMITVNYGSDSTGTMGAPPQEAAAEVAYANATASIYGGASDIKFGADAAGVNWRSAGFWAKLRSSTPAQYQAWATAAGDYNPAYSFLAINHPAPENIKYWEIGNEIGGNGYFGPQWEYDLHAPYFQGDVHSNTGRLNNPLLSPTAYAQNLNQFANLMRQVDPTIRIGAGFNAAANDPNDAAILNTAGSNIDFGIIHWYPTSTLPGAVTTGTGALPTKVANLRSTVQAHTAKGYNGLQITMTEFAYSAANSTPMQRSLFAADAYATGFENGVVNMDFQEMSSPSYLDAGTVSPGEVYYAMQMVHDFAGAGGTFESTSYTDSLIRVHAIKRTDGSVALLLINDGSAADHSQDRRMMITLTGGPYANSGLAYTFGTGNIGTTDTPPTQQTLTGLGSTFSVTVPQQSMEVIVLPSNASGTHYVSTWTGTAMGPPSAAWNRGDNWDTNPNYPNNGQPNATDAYDVIINDGGPIYGFTALNIDASVQNFTLNGGDLVKAAAPHSLTVNGVFTWTGGMLGDGITLNAQGGLLISGSGTKTLAASTNQTQINNFAAANWTGGDINATPLNGPSVLHNMSTGTFNVSAAGAKFNAPFANDGITNINVGSGNVVTFTNYFTGSGTVNVNSGTLVLAFGATGASTLSAKSFAQASLSIGSGSTVTLATNSPRIASTLNELTIMPGGKLDIANNSISINYGANPDPNSAIAALVQAGRKTPAGIYSSTALAPRIWLSATPMTQPTMSS